MHAATLHKGVYPLSADVEAHLRQMQKRHPDLVAVRELARTSEDRPILAAIVTDPAVPADDRQHALIVAGQHGDEESGRMVALALLDWLVSDEGAVTRRQQLIAILPNVNPDGADRDAHETPAGGRPNRDHGPAGACTPEGRAVEIMAEELQPELFVDLHARGNAGCSYDMVLYPWTRPYQEDEFLLRTLADEMVAAGEAAGIPHVTHPLTWPGWGEPGGDEPSTTNYAYRNFRSLVFLTENAEHNTHAYPLAVRTASGLEKMKVLLAHGNRRHAWFAHRGYPVGLIGLRSGGLVAAGATASARRRSRLALWRRIDDLLPPRPARHPEEARLKTLRFGYRGAALDVDIGAQFRVAGHAAVVGVRLDGRPLASAGTPGYVTWQDACSTFFLIAAPRLAPGEHEWAIELEP